MWEGWGHPLLPATHCTASPPVTAAEELARLTAHFPNLYMTCHSSTQRLHVAATPAELAAAVCVCTAIDMYTHTQPPQPPFPCTTQGTAAFSPFGISLVHMISLQSSSGGVGGSGLLCWLLWQLG